MIYEDRCPECRGGLFVVSDVYGLEARCVRCSLRWAPFHDRLTFSGHVSTTSPQTGFIPLPRDTLPEYVSEYLKPAA